MAAQTAMQWTYDTGDSATEAPAPVERGFVPTPEAVVDLMVEKLFRGRPPTRESRVLDAGCGRGPFIEGIVRWCRRHHVELPRIVGVEIDPGRARDAAARFAAHPSIEIVRRDFLSQHSFLSQPSPAGRLESGGGLPFDYVIGNPPYVPITGLSEDDKAKFRREFRSACGRFDLYLLFFEQGLRLLKAGGRLVFITPEKFLYVKSAEPLRKLLGAQDVREIHLLDEETFPELVTYPTITTVEARAPSGGTAVHLRDGAETRVAFPGSGASLQPLFHGHAPAEPAAVESSDADPGVARPGVVRSRVGPTLDDLCLRVSCGVATGADAVFVHRTRSLPAELRRFAFPTISGRQLVPGQEHIESHESMLIPYDRHGELLPAEQLGALGRLLGTRQNRARLNERTCVERKPWYAFHDSVPLEEMLRPKILCKDITSEPAFWIDREGTLVPRHSVYYIVPRDPGRLDEIADCLNSPRAKAWLRAHCQRASNGYLRLQSAILKQLPVPEALAAPMSARETPRPPVRPRSPSRYGELVLSR